MARDQARREFRRLRVEVLDWSQKELADRLLTSERNVQRWEAGVHKVPKLAMDKIRKLAAEHAAN